MTQSESIEFKYPYFGQPILAKDFLKIRYGSGKSENWVEEKLVCDLLINDNTVNKESLIKTEDIVRYRHCRKDESFHNIKLKILYEDQFYLAISKPDFLPVSPSGAYFYSSLAILIKDKFPSLDISPVHRLDIETSGVLIFGKSKKARGKICKLFVSNDVEKSYQAITWGKPRTQSISGDIELDKNSKIYSKYKINEASDNKEIVTEILDSEPLNQDFYLNTIRPISGKTNQIRVHLSSLGCPIVGDKKYFFDENVYLDWVENRDFSRVSNQLLLERQALHCRKIQFKHPFTESIISIEDEADCFVEKVNHLAKIKSIKPIDIKQFYD